MQLQLGKKKLSREEVRKVKTPAPSGTHYPIPHSTDSGSGIIDALERGLRQCSYDIIEEDHVLNSAGARYFGCFKISNGETDLLVGVRNSHDRMFSASMFIGAMVGDSVSFVSEKTLARRHTSGIMDDMPHLISAILSNLKVEGKKIIEMTKKYKAISLSHSESALFLLSIAKSEIIPASKVYTIFDNWENGDLTLWRLYAETTKVLVDGNQMQFPARTMKLKDACDDYEENGIQLRFQIS